MPVDNARIVFVPKASDPLPPTSCHISQGTSLNIRSQN
jgi:hypothetical protein